MLPPWPRPALRPGTPRAVRTSALVRVTVADCFHKVIQTISAVRPEPPFAAGFARRATDVRSLAPKHVTGVPAGTLETYDKRTTLRWLRGPPGNGPPATRRKPATYCMHGGPANRPSSPAGSSSSRFSPGAVAKGARRYEIRRFRRMSERRRASCTLSERTEKAPKIVAYCGLAAGSWWETRANSDP